MFKTDITDRVALLDDIIGVPASGYEVGIRYLDLARQKGKTSELIKVLTEGSTVLVYNDSIKDGIVWMLKQTRPEFDVDSLTFIVKEIEDIDELYGIVSKTMMDKNIRNMDTFYIDNAIWDMIYMSQLKRLYRKGI